MKSKLLTLIFAMLLLCGVVLAGCGGSCSDEDVNACTTSFATCKAPCIGDKSCHDKCQSTYCDCMDSAGCDPPSNCKSN